MSIHIVYAKLTPEETQAVDVAFEEAAKVLKDYGFAVANDDTAERLVEAIAVFLKASQKTH